jgi:hypothetical protein
MSELMFASVFTKAFAFAQHSFFVFLFELSDREKAEYYEVVFGVVWFTENVRQYDGYRE